ncbi:Fc.00g000710.m01.CDS01 [Cosmosporella sp. VM-42]
MQEHLVFSTFSRARQSVMSRTRKAFTPRALIKDAGEDPDNKPSDLARSSAQDTDEPKLSEGAASIATPANPPDLEWTKKDQELQKELQSYRTQIGTLEKKIVELEQDAANHAKSAEASMASVTKLEEKVKELEAMKSSKIKQANAYAAESEELRAAVKKLKEEEGSRRNRAEVHKAQLEELETKVEELQREQRRVGDTDMTIGELQREIEEKRQTVNSRDNNITTLENSITQLRDAKEVQHGTFVKQQHDIEAKHTEIQQLQQESQEKDKTIDYQKNEIHTKDAKINQLQQETQEKGTAIDYQKNEIHSKDTRINQLQAESQEKGKVIDYQKNEIRIKDTKITQLQQENHEQFESIKFHKSEIVAKDKTIAQLRVDMTEATEAAVNAAGLVPHLPLYRSEVEIIDSWQKLADSVEAFVSTYLGEVGSQQIRRWVRSQGRSKIPAHSPPAISGDVYVSCLVEASIWDTLARLVFADSTLFGGICWSGQYRAKISKLSGPILQSMETADQHAQGLFHLWKAATTNLLAALGPHEGRDEKVLEIVSELLSLLDNLPIHLSREELIMNLMSIVEQAVILDETLCGQQTWFFLRYPYQRSDIDVDLGVMEVKEGVSPGPLVKFVIRPALCKAGGGGEDFGVLSIVKRHLVFV